MESKTLGIAIIGAGAIAEVHIQSFLQYREQCEVRAVCDFFIEKAQGLIETYQLPAVMFKDYRDLLEQDNIDAVSICLPPSMHADATIDALNAGKHVICEKPMAGSLEECDNMIKAANKNNKLLSVVAQNRYKTPNQKVKRLLEEGVIGRVLFATVNSLWWRGENYYDIWWRGTWEKESGGCLINHAVHHIDLLQWMLGMPESVNAIISNVGHFNSECEDLAIAVLRYPKMVAQLTASIVTHNEEQELIFEGEKASISVPWQVSASKALANGFPEPDDETRDAIQNIYDELPELDVEGHPAQIGNFLNAISGKEALLIDGEQGRKTIELITAIYKSACRNSMVELPIQPDDVFYCKGGIVQTMPRFYEKSKSIDNFAPSKPISLGRDVGK